MPITAHLGKPGLVLVRDGRVRLVLSPAQLRLLLALEERNEPVPVRQATRIIWPAHTGALTGSQRASAARSIGRLLDRDMAHQDRYLGPLTLTERGRRFLAARRDVIAEAVELT